VKVEAPSLRGDKPTTSCRDCWDSAILTALRPTRRIAEGQHLGPSAVERSNRYGYTSLQYSDNQLAYRFTCICSGSSRALCRMTSWMTATTYLRGFPRNSGDLTAALGTPVRSRAPRLLIYLLGPLCVSTLVDIVSALQIRGSYAVSAQLSAP
jgi:hypothetical protein